MYRLIISIILFIFSSLSFADHIKCYSHGNLIYSHKIRDVTYTGDAFVFTTEPDDTIMVFNGDCLLKLKK